MLTYQILVDGECVGTFSNPKAAAKMALSAWSAFGANRDEHDVDIVDSWGCSAWNLCMEELEPEPR